MNMQALIVEDDPGLRLTLTDLFAAESYDVETAADGPSGLTAALGKLFDLIILDVMLPGMSGSEVCRRLRERGCDSPVLMLTAKAQTSDLVHGLKIGADDYLTKPFDPAELLARADALLRRSGRKKRAPISHYAFGDVAADFAAGQVTKAGVSLNLASKEMLLLYYLVERRGVVVSRDELLQSVWKYQTDVSTRTVDVHVAWLRQKLEENPQNPRHIQTVRGIGYIFKD